MNNAPLTRDALSRPTVGTIGEEGEDAQPGQYLSQCSVSMAHSLELNGLNELFGKQDYKDEDAWDEGCLAREVLQSFAPTTC